jgi:DNA-binding transcriptional MerR regulator
MTIAELAERAGVPVSTVRFYERRGALPAPERDANGYRRYSPDDLRRVRFLRRGRRLGFTLGELAAFVALSDGGAGAVASHDVQEAGSAKIAEIDERISDLVRVRAALVEVLGNPCPDAASPCPIIGALADDEAATAAL